MAFQLLGKQMFFSNLHFFFYSVTRDLYQLHAIAQGRLHSTNVVGGGNEQDLG